MGGIMCPCGDGFAEMLRQRTNAASGAGDGFVAGTCRACVWGRIYVDDYGDPVCGFCGCRSISYEGC